MKIPHIPKYFKALSVLCALFQGNVIAHELIHQAIFKYFNVTSRMEIGFFGGRVVPDFAPQDATVRASMYLAHSLNEVVLPISILLIFVVTIIVYNTMED